MGCGIEGAEEAIVSEGGDDANVRQKVELVKAELGEGSFVAVEAVGLDEIMDF